MFGHFVKIRRPSLLQAVQRPLHTLLFLVSFLYRLFHGTIALTKYLTAFLPCLFSTIIKYVSFIFTLDDTFRQRFFGINARSRLSADFFPDFREFRVNLCLPDFLCFLNLSKKCEPFASRPSRILVTSSLKAAVKKKFVELGDEEEETAAILQNSCKIISLSLLGKDGWI